MANSWAVHGIRVLVTHRKTVLDTVPFTPVKPLAVLGYFQSWLRVETASEDMVGAMNEMVVAIEWQGFTGRGVGWVLNQTKTNSNSFFISLFEI